MVIIDIVINTLLGRLTLDPAAMQCPAWDDAFVSSSELRPIKLADENKNGHAITSLRQAM